MDRRATPREAGNRNQNQFLSVGRKVTTAFMPICLCCDGVTAAGRRNPRPAEARRATTNAATRITTSALWRARATQHGRVCATALPLTTTPTRRPSGGGGGDGGEHDTGASHHRASADENKRENGREEQGGSSTEELRQKAHRHTAADRPPHTNKGGDKKILIPRPEPPRRRAAEPPSCLELTALLCRAEPPSRAAEPRSRAHNKNT